MINVSKEFIDTMATRTDFKPSAEITFLDGSVESMDWKDFTLQNNSVVDGAGSTSFPLGAAVEKSIQIEIRNDDDKFSNFDFIGAKIRLFLNFALSETTERISYGTFTVLSPETYGETIIITAVDDMYKADTPYQTGLTFPVSLREAVLDVCDRCGLVLQTARFKNDTFIVQNIPENLTNREFLAMAAQIACGYARMDYMGRLCINSYDFSAFEREDGLWGGYFDKDNPYSSGDNAYGGIFNPWDEGDEYAGGTFLEMDDYHVFYNFKSIKVDTDDVVITGIQTTVDETTYLAGSEGYVLSITNQLISGQEQAAVDLIGQSIIGVRFRPFTADHIAYPLAEFGDLAYIVDRKQNVYQTILTDIDFTFLGYTTLKCAADSPLRNSSKFASSVDQTKAIVAARKETEEQLTAYDKAVQNMTSIIANSMGMFETVEETESGGRIIYQHDKPTLAESTIIWKKTELAFMVSQDGGQTWVAGIDASGNSVVNMLSAIGINFSWARGGTLTLGGGANGNGTLRILNASGTQIGYIDNTGVHFNAGTFSGELRAATGSFTGTVNATTLKSANAEITGGKINIKSSSQNDDVIELSYGNYKMLINPFRGVRCFNTFNGTFASLEGAGVSAGSYSESGGTITYTSKAGFYGSGLLFSNYAYEQISGYSPNLYVDSSGTFRRSSSSSKRYKEQIKEDIDQSMDPNLLYEVPVKQFTYKKGYLSNEDKRKGKPVIGFIAEDIAEKYPIAAEYDADGRPEMWSSSVLIPAMLKLIQEQNKRILSLEKKMEKMEEWYGNHS